MVTKQSLSRRLQESGFRSPQRVRHTGQLASPLGILVGCELTARSRGGVCLGRIEQVEAEPCDGGAVGSHLVKGGARLGAEMLEWQCRESGEQHQVQRMRASVNLGDTWRCSRGVVWRSGWLFDGVAR